MYYIISPKNKNLFLRILTKYFKKGSDRNAVCTFQRTDSRQEQFLWTCFLGAELEVGLRRESWKSAGLSLCGSSRDHCEHTRERTFKWNSQPWFPPWATVSILHSTFCLIRQRFARRAVIHMLGCSTLTAGWKIKGGVVDLSGKIKRK